jgi:hypothetical protein
MVACDSPSYSAEPNGSPLSGQLLQMIYVASQEGLPGFLFHLQKKELCRNVIRELGITLTAAFCFPVKELLLQTVAFSFHTESQNLMKQTPARKGPQGKEKTVAQQRSETDERSPFLPRVLGQELSIVSALLNTVKALLLLMISLYCKAPLLNIYFSFQ